MKLCSIIILNWNGHDLLKQCLPSVVDAVKRSVYRCEVLVVDNGSTDASLEMVARDFPSVRILALERNYGFGEGNNRGVHFAMGEIVLLLNNDMVVDPGFLDPLIKGFETESHVFAIGCQIFFQDVGKKREETGKTSVCWDLGAVEYFHQDVTDLDTERKYVASFWASGGAVAYDKQKFLQLDGFRSLYSPAYVEDADLSYRAWKRGWRVLFCPASIVHHKHRASTGKRFTSRELELLIRRNRLLFIWSNIADWRMLCEHALGLAYRIVIATLTRRPNLDWRALLKALPYLSEARAFCHSERAFTTLRDEELLKRHTWKREFLKRQQRLSILFVSPYVPCLGLHATGNRMFHIAQELSSKHEIHVLTYIETEEDLDRASDLREFCKSVRFIRRRNYFTEPDYLHTKPRDVRTEFVGEEMKGEIVASAISGRFDVIQFEFLQMAYFGRFVRRFGLPLVWVDHEVQHSSLWTQLRLSPLLSLRRIVLCLRSMYMLSFELGIAKGFDHTIVVTERDEEELKGYLPSLHTSVVPLGIDLDYFLPSAVSANDSTDHVLLFTGYFRHRPNLDAVEHFIADILPLVRKRIPEVLFEVVGYDPTGQLRSFEDLPGVRIMGWVPDLRPYLKRATVYVAPIRLGVGMRGKILEALAMEKPVVATSLASRGFEACEGKGLSIADGPSAFADKVVDLLLDDQRRSHEGLIGRQVLARRFSWQLVAELNHSVLTESIRSS